MPKLAVYGKLIFFVFAYDLSERWHVHVANNKSERKRSGKIWLDTLAVFERGNLTDKEINTAVNVLRENKEKILSSISNFAEGVNSKHYGYERYAELQKQQADY